MFLKQTIVTTKLVGNSYVRFIYKSKTITIVIQLDPRNTTALLTVLYYLPYLRNVYLLNNNYLDDFLRLAQLKIHIVHIALEKVVISVIPVSLFLKLYTRSGTAGRTNARQVVYGPIVLEPVLELRI